MVDKKPASKRFFSSGLPFALILPLLFAVPAFVPYADAQVALPGSAQPGRAEQPILSTPLKPRSTGAPVVQEDALDTDFPDVDVTFKLQKVIFEGATVFTQADFAELYSDVLGREIPVAKIFEIAQKATAFYRSKGYILSQVVVPPQEIDGGTVRFQAVEGFVDKVVVAGDMGGRQNLVAVYTEKITAERPLRAKTVERYLLLAGDLAGMTVKGVFSPSPDTPGAATLTVQSKHKRIEAAFEIANDGSDFVGPNLGTGEIIFNSIFNFHERIGIRVAASGDAEELLLGELYGSIPVGTEGTQLFGRISNSVSEPGNGLQNFAIANDAFRWSLGASHPFIRSRRKNLFAGLQFDWDDLKSDSDIFGRLSEDHLRVVRGYADFDFVDSWLGASRPAVTAIHVRASLGFDAFGGTQNSDLFRTRANADGSFAALDAEIQRFQRIGIPGVTILMAAKGQITSEAVLASEEFGFGGSDYGRGYDPSAIVGDRGVAGKIELQYQRAVNSIPLLENYQVFSFLDGGIVQNIDQPGARSTVTNELYSAGGGIRLDFAHDFEAEFALAWRGMTDASVRNLGADRLRGLFRVVKRF